eukprot:tig00000903_g5504.t1
MLALRMAPPSARGGALLRLGLAGRALSAPIAATVRPTALLACGAPRAAAAGILAPAGARCASTRPGRSSTGPNELFVERHLLAVLTEWDANQRPPFDLALSHYARANRALGSKDRRLLAETAYALLRWKGLLDAVILREDSRRQATWELRLGAWRRHGEAVEELLREGRSPRLEALGLRPHQEVSFPRELYAMLVDDYGEPGARALALALNTQAPKTIRANALRVKRESLLGRFPGSRPTRRAPHGVVFEAGVDLVGTPEFREGLFELQDEGSQLVAGLVEAGPGETVLDYCGGAAGKMLAIAPGMRGTGQGYVHDVREGILQQARKRLRRAGVQNVQVLPAGPSPALAALRRKCDWVLVDAPCSGTGTLRRNPDMKWSIGAAGVAELARKQEQIIADALPYVRAGAGGAGAARGRLVYAVCSVLSAEGERVVEAALEAAGGRLSAAGDFLRVAPERGGPDGFFAAVLQAS